MWLKRAKKKCDMIGSRTVILLLIFLWLGSIIESIIDFAASERIRLLRGRVSPPKILKPKETGNNAKRG